MNYSGGLSWSEENLFIYITHLLSLPQTSALFARHFDHLPHVKRDTRTQSLLPCAAKNAPIFAFSRLAIYFNSLQL